MQAAVKPVRQRSTCLAEQQDLTVTSMNALWVALAGHTRPASWPGRGRASRSCSCSWPRSRGTAGSFSCTRSAAGQLSAVLEQLASSRAAQQYLWKVTCLGFTWRFFTSTLLPHSTIGMFSHTLHARGQLSACRLPSTAATQGQRHSTCRGRDARWARSCTSTAR